jgi:RNA polymerase sigma-70 factor (ECF subfamily)
VITSAVEEAFTAQRPRLLGLAYRITGSVADAEDVLQDAWLRIERSDSSRVEDPTAWLVTMVSRLALDELKRAHHRREEYVGPWLPEPVPTRGAGVDPAESVEMAESLTLAYLQLLESLSPVERVAILLADVFEVPFANIAEVLDRSEGSCRQLASRARRRLRDTKPVELPRSELPFDAAPFVAAITAGDMAKVMSLLAPDVVLTSDGGPQVHAARRPVHGAERVARLLTNLGQRVDFTGLELKPHHVNHSPGFLVSFDGIVFGVFAANIDDDGLVNALWIMINPEKLAAFAAPPELV